MQFIQRKVYQQLKNHLDKPEISLILGPRQAGKTTIMKKLQEESDLANKKTCYFNLDVIEEAQYFHTQHKLLHRIETLAGKTKTLVFIDEIQRLPDAGLFLKGLYDLATGHKFIVSGSGSLELKENVIEPMTGRKRIFYCLPLSFTEFAGYKLNLPFEQIEDNLLSNPYETERLTSEYLVFGGYPSVVLRQTENEKMEILKEIFQSYLEKDIQLLLKVEKETAFTRLVSILSSQTGNLVNRQELSNTLGISVKTVERYLFFLEKTFVINLVKPFFTNARKELTKAPKIYFTDLGFLTLAKGSLKTIDGGRFENAIYLRLKELEKINEIHYWRSQSGAEVDFILNPDNQQKPVPVEAKYQICGKRLTLGKSLISFVTNYKTDKAYIYSKDTDMKIERFGTQIQYLPYHLLPRFS